MARSKTNVAYLQEMCRYADRKRERATDYYAYRYWDDAYQYYYARLEAEVFCL